MRTARWLSAAWLLSLIPLHGMSAPIDAVVSSPGGGPRTLLSGVSGSVSFRLVAADMCDRGAGCPTRRVQVLAVPLGDWSRIYAQQEVVLERGKLTDVEGALDIEIEPEGRYNLVLLAVDSAAPWSEGAPQNASSVLSTHTLREALVITPILCLFPAVAILAVVALTRNVYVAMFSGLFVGGTLISPGFNPLQGFMRAGDRFLYEAMQGQDMGLLLFTWFVSGMVGVISRNGGASGLGAFFARHASTSRRAQLLAATAGLLVFWDDYSSILIVGNTMRPVLDACHVSREKLAFLVDTMAAPVAAMSPVSTWIGFKLSVVRQQLISLGVTEDGLSVLMRAIPSSTYPILAIVFAFLVSATGRDFGPMAAAEARARERGHQHLHGGDLAEERGRGGGDEEEDEMDEGEMAAGMDPSVQPDADKPARAMNAVVPVLVMVVGTVGGIWASGQGGYFASEGPYAPPPGVFQILSHAETTRVLVWASLLASAFGIALSVAQGILTLDQSMEAWLSGVRTITDGLMVMIMAWGVGSMSNELHVGAYMAEAIGESLPKALLPPAAMFISGIVSLSTGSSWGAMVLLFPLALPLAAAGAAPGDADDLMISTIGAVISGSMFGDHVSPISDTTVLSSLSSSCTLAGHVGTQGPYACTVFAVSLAVSLATALAPPWAAALLLFPAIALLLAILLLFGTRASHVPQRRVQDRWRVAMRVLGDFGGERDTLVDNQADPAADAGRP